jgi:hypothetical protein
LPRLPGGVSAFYQSDSLLPGQPRYTNAVAALDSALAPLDLLDALQAIENDQGRNALTLGPRTLDLDILLFGDRLIDEPRLKVPHYHSGASHSCIRWPNWLQPICAWPMAALATCSPPARSSAWNASPTPEIGMPRVHPWLTAVPGFVSAYCMGHAAHGPLAARSVRDTSSVLNRISNAGNTPRNNAVTHAIDFPRFSSRL